MLPIHAPEWQHRALDLVTRIVAAAALLHSVLPPWDWQPDFVSEGLADFPAAQKAFRSAFHNRYYKLVVYVCGYLALHARSTVWRSISIQKQLKDSVK